MRRLLVVVGLLAVAFTVAQSPASAHARLVSSTPAEGTLLAAPPEQVVLTFDEEVDAALSSVELAAPGRPPRQLDLGVGQAPDELRAALPDGLVGRQVVVWRAVATDDGHAQEGRLSFTVSGAPAAAAAAVVAPARPPSGRAAGAVYGTARWLALLGFCVVVGTAFFGAVCTGDEPVPTGRRRALLGGWVLLLGASLVALLMYGGAVSGRPLGQVLDGDVLRAGATSPVGVTLAIRLLLVAIAAPVAIAGRRVGAVAVGAWAAAAAATWSLIGHSRSGGAPLLMVPVDAAHLCCAAVWLGGLVALLASGRALAATAVRRFSTVAMTCVAVLVATGVVQAWRRVGTSAALADTGYGRLLVGKLALVAATLAAAGLVRRRLRATRRPGIRRGVLVEAALGTAVLAVTSVLVVTEPAREEHAQVVAARAAAAIRPVRPADPVTATAPFDTGRPGGQGRLAIEVVPQVGPTSVHLAVLTADGRPADARVVVALRPVGSTGSGLAITMQRLDVGHFVSRGAIVPAPGSWEIGVGVLLPDGGRASTRAAFTVR